MANADPEVIVISDPRAAAYGFGGGHPFGPNRHEAFLRELGRHNFGDRVQIQPGRIATRAELEAFHAPEYLERVHATCRAGPGFLDGGDTPAAPGLYEAAAAVVGATLSGVEAVMTGSAPRAFVPIAGLHHAGRGHAAGFCVFNDCGVAIELLRSRFGVRRVAYVDIDAHHGDGVYYGFEDDPDLLFADIHEDGRYLYPGTGAAHETGTGPARGMKLNIPLAPGAADPQFFQAWERVEAHLRSGRPEFILLQCGADSLAGDPLAHLQLSPKAHGHAAARLRVLAGQLCAGRIVATGGGGYDLGNIGRAWVAVVEAFAEPSG